MFLKKKEGIVEFGPLRMEHSMVREVSEMVVGEKGEIQASFLREDDGLFLFKAAHVKPIDSSAFANMKPEAENLIRIRRTASGWVINRSPQRVLPGCFDEHRCIRVSVENW